MRKPIPPMDLMFFLLESPQSPKHVAAVQVFKKPKNAPDTYLRDLVAAFKAAPVVAPFNYYPHFPRMGMPEWRVQEDMDMDTERESSTEWEDTSEDDTYGAMNDNG